MKLKCPDCGRFFYSNTKSNSRHKRPINMMCYYLLQLQGDIICSTCWNKLCEEEKEELIEWKNKCVMRTIKEVNNANEFLRNFICS